MSPILSLQGKNLARKIPNVSIPFECFVNKSDFFMETKLLSINKSKDAFYSLKSNKRPGYDYISYDLINKCFGSLCKALKYLFKGVFPGDLKIARVTSNYKCKDSSDVSNYRPISVLPCFPKYSGA